MAKNQTPKILPDLPEDWGYGQTVAPEGPEVGLSERHGYNYLMKKVNRAATLINEIYEEMGRIVPEDMVRLAGGGEMVLHGAFGTAPHTIDVIEEKPAAGIRFVVGTTESGHTEHECDYLCDGTADDVEIGEALNALAALGGGELLFLPGTYQLSADISITSENFEIITLRGTCQLSTVIVGPAQISRAMCSLHVYGLSFQNIFLYSTTNYNDAGSLIVRECSFKVDASRIAASTLKAVIYSGSRFASVSGCKFTTYNDGGSLEGAKFLYLTHGCCDVRYNSFEGHIAQESGKINGISVSGLVAMSFIGCNELTYVGQAIAASGSVIIFGNKISNADTGIYDSDRTSQIIANHLNGIKKTGVHGGYRVFDNYVVYSGNSQDAVGIDTWCYSYTNITNNYMSGFPIGIRLFSSSEVMAAKNGAVLSNNSINQCAVGILLGNGTRIVQGDTIDLYSNRSILLGNIILDSTGASIKIESRHGRCLVSQNICPDAAIVDQGSNNTITGNVIE